MHINLICMYHGCCMLTNLIAQLEVGNFHKHLPRGGYFLPKAMLIHVLFFSGHYGTSPLHHSVSVSTRYHKFTHCNSRPSKL